MEVLNQVEVLKQNKIIVCDIVKYWSMLLPGTIYAKNLKMFKRCLSKSMEENYIKSYVK